MRVQIIRTLYETPETGFRICLAEILESSEEDRIPRQVDTFQAITVKGYFPVNKAVTLVLSGEWQKDKYGYSLWVSDFKEVVQTTESGIIAYLSASVKGVKEGTAKKIVEQFGLKTLDVFENSPEELLAIKGIGRKKLVGIIESFKETRAIQEIVTYLAPVGVTPNKCAKIAKCFGGEAMNVLLNDPFRLCEIEGFGFLVVDEIARKTSFSPTDPLRIKGAIKYVLQAAATEGHLCLNQIECILCAYLILNGVDWRRLDRRANRALEAHDLSTLRTSLRKEDVNYKLVKDQFVIMALASELKGDNGYAYLPLPYQQETETAKIISERLMRTDTTEASDEDVAQIIEDQEKVLGIRLASKQREAVALAVRENTCIITGGPGVGKTTVLKVVLAACTELNGLSVEDVTLLAPTGRAAQRMAESVGDGYTASTIHSALRITAGDDSSYGDKLNTKLVVVDESSMVDAHICWLLLKAIPKSAKLIIIGDPEQLPSVGAGNVLYEFLSCKKIPTVKLDVIYRQAGISPIVTNSALIQSGATNLLYEENFQFYDVPQKAELDNGTNVQQLAANIVIEQYLAAVREHGIDEVQVLCPFRKAGVIAGATELNKAIQERVNPKSPLKPQIKRGHNIYRLGDKVIQTKNNKDIGVYNGDVGYIKAIDTKEDEITISFNGTSVVYDAAQMTDVDLAYAISIHKSQGSQYHTVIIPILNDFFVMLRRNLIYTGITRAKEKVVLVGHRSALSTAIKSNFISHRNTQLAARIIQFTEEAEEKKESANNGEQLKLEVK